MVIEFDSGHLPSLLQIPWFTSSTDIPFSDLPSGKQLSVNSWLHNLASISFTSVCFTKEKVFSFFICICLSYTYLLVPLTGPTMHQPSLVLNAYGLSFSLGMVSIGYRAFAQFAPISNSTEMSSFWLILPTILCRCFHCLNIFFINWQVLLGIFIWKFQPIMWITIATCYSESCHCHCLVCDLSIEGLYCDWSLLPVHTKVVYQCFQDKGILTAAIQ